MPKTKKKNKTKGNPFIYKSLTVFFATATICLAVIATFLFLNRKTDLEQKKIQVAETVIKRYFDTNPLVSSEFKDYTHTEATSIDISKDNDLYVEFRMMRNDQNHIPEFVEKGVMYFQCKNSDGKVIGTDNPSACSMAVSYEEPKYIGENLRNQIKTIADQAQAKINNMNAQLKEVYGPENYTEEDGNLQFNDKNLTEEQQKRAEEINNQFVKELSEINYNELSNLYEEVWNYL